MKNFFFQSNVANPKADKPSSKKSKKSAPVDDLLPFRREVLRLEAEKLKREMRNFDLRNEVLERFLAKDKKKSSSEVENCREKGANVMFSQVFESDQVLTPDSVNISQIEKYLLVQSYEKL